MFLNTTLHCLVGGGGEMTVCGKDQLTALQVRIPGSQALPWPDEGLG